MSKCYFCGEEGMWCDLCKVYLCNTHRGAYIRRLLAAAKEMLNPSSDRHTT